MDANWYVAYDGAQCGCVPVCPAVPARWRRFSPYCRLVDVSPFVPQAYFKVSASYATTGTQLAFSHDRVYMEVFRKGCEHTLLVTYNVWRRDANGSLGFYFDDTLFANPGFYVGDVFINCEYCFSVQLRVPVCAAVVTECYIQPVLETCGESVCALFDPVGAGMVGGGDCAMPSVTECGVVAPFFELFDPVGGTVAPCGPTGCCFVPEPAGSTSAG